MISKYSASDSAGLSLTLRALQIYLLTYKLDPEQTLVFVLHVYRRSAVVSITTLISLARYGSTSH